MTFLLPMRVPGSVYSLKVVLPPVCSVPETSRPAQSRPLRVEGVQPYDTYVMATRNEINRLLDGLPDDRVAVISEILPAAWGAGLIGDQVHRLAKQLRGDTDLARPAAERVGRFAGAGALSAGPYLVEPSDETLRTETLGTAA